MATDALKQSIKQKNVEDLFDEVVGNAFNKVEYLPRLMENHKLQSEKTICNQMWRYLFKEFLKKTPKDS